MIGAQARRITVANRGPRQTRSAGHGLCAAILAAGSVLMLHTAVLGQRPPADAPPSRDTSRGDAMIAAYFAAETQRLAAQALADIQTSEDWTSRASELRRQAQEMLGLDPWPERGELHAQTTGRIERENFVVEKVHFQSLPGLYVTGNLYLPKSQTGPAPAVLYVCGHSRVKQGDTSYGNKTHYQYHGIWFARNGYVCLTIDTIQLGEIEGIHHGTYSEGHWWWNSRGYTPAGVECWNGIRALDYLQTRPEVDPDRLGVTGRSGGGAYSWWIAALDERIKAAVPVAGITDLTNHVIDGCVEGHCDCMYLVNTYRWDYAQLAALVAPRPLLIANTDSDPIFPLDGVERLHAQVRRIYRLLGADDRLGLFISPGPHQDTQELQVAAGRWFNRFLKGEDSPVEQTGISAFEPAELKVFASLPADQINTSIHESFVPQAPQPQPPADAAGWEADRARWTAVLRERVFGGWPDDPGPLDCRPICDAASRGLRLAVYEYNSQPHVRLPLYVVHPQTLPPGAEVVLRVVDDAQWLEVVCGLHALFPEASEIGAAVPRGCEPDTAWAERLGSELEMRPQVLVYAMPRGVGPTAWDQSERKQVQYRRRFMLLGQTLAGMQAWDVLRAVQAVREAAVLGNVPIVVTARGEMVAVALYAMPFAEGVACARLAELPRSGRDAPDLLNFLRWLDMPQLVALAADRLRPQDSSAQKPTLVLEGGAGGWEYVQALARQLGWSHVQFSE